MSNAPLSFSLFPQAFKTRIILESLHSVLHAGITATAPFEITHTGRHGAFATFAALLRLDRATNSLAVALFKQTVTLHCEVVPHLYQPMPLMAGALNPAPRLKKIPEQVVDEMRTLEISRIYTLWPDPASPRWVKNVRGIVKVAKDAVERHLPLEMRWEGPDGYVGLLFEIAMRDWTEAFGERVKEGVLRLFASEEAQGMSMAEMAMELGCLFVEVGDNLIAV